MPDKSRSKIEFVKAASDSQISMRTYYLIMQCI